MSERMMRTLDEYTAKFSEQMSFGVKAVHAAACVYVEALRRFPTNGARHFAEVFPDISKDTWTVLEKIGNGKLIPEFYFMGRKQAAVFAKLPVKVQETIQKSKGVQIVSQKTLTVIDEPVRAEDLTLQQAQILIDENKKRVRSVQEQMALVRRSANAWTGSKRRTSKGRWKLDKEAGKLHILKPCVFTLENLKQFVTELEGDKE